MAKSSPIRKPLIQVQRPIKPMPGSDEVMNALERFFSGPQKDKMAPMSRAPPPPGSRMPKHISTSAKPKPDQNTQKEDSALSSIPINLDELEAVGSTPITINSSLAHLDAKGLFQSLANLCVNIQPELESKEISFEMFGLQAGDEVLADIIVTNSNVEIKIPLTELGYPDIKSLPMSSLINQFNTSRNLFGALLGTSTEVAIVARKIDGVESIELCLYGKRGKPLTKFSQQIRR